MSFATLILHNVTVKKLRLALTALAVAIGVLAVVSLGVVTYRIAGIYSTGQALGDTGAMFPLAWFQTYQRQPSQYTLLFVVITPGVPSPRCRPGSTVTSRSW